MPAKNYWPALSLLGLVMFAHQLHGDSIPITWLSSIGTTGNWSTASNWDLGVVPNNSDGTTYAVTIPMLRSVVVDISPTVDSLNAAGSHVEVISGNTLTTSTLSVFPPPHPLAGVVDVDSGATLNVPGSATLTGSTHLEIGGTANMGSVNLLNVEGDLDISGTANVSS